MRGKASLFGTVGKVKGCASPRSAAVSDIYMSPGQISNQYSTVALYSIFTSARMTVACAGHAKSTESATVYGLLIDLRKEIHLATGLNSDDLFISAITDHARALRAVSMSYWGHHPMYPIRLNI